MNYTKIYIALIERGSKRTREKGDGLHKHRILPGYQGGEYIDWNITYLTRKEHRLVHKLRYKIFGDVKEMGAYKQLGGKLTDEQVYELASLGGKKGSAVGIARKVGIHGMSKDRRSEVGRKSAQEQMAKKLGLHASSLEQRQKYGHLGGSASWTKKSGWFDITPEEHSEKARKAGLITIAKKTGLHGLSKEQRYENAKRGGLAGGSKGGKAAAISQKETNTGFWGFSKEQRSEYGARGGKKGGKIAAEKNKKNGTGLYGLSTEQRRETGRLLGGRGGVAASNKKVGIHGLSEEQRSDFGARGGRKGGLAAKGRKFIRCKTSGKLFRPSIGEAWLMVLSGAYEYKSKILNAACQGALSIHQEIFSGAEHD